ncbi:MAG: NAD(P)H-dependent oxidoreductase subunit E [Anaerovoracaceae bacterium]|nr:NAD(P)H-dependent oxidoreductase subunit E [Bacillota bacterium]MDY3954410.1 NAD(P)H-dependent oxidoreductase subunit E [Anaerovoracaceae bacterium]
MRKMQNDCKCNCNKISADDKRFVELKEYIDSLNGAQGVTMSVLQEAQRIFGYLPLEVQKFISDEINVPIAEIYGVSTFYSQFNLTPKGKHKIGICLGTACYVKGAQAVIDEVAKQLDIAVGDTTPDGIFTLEATRCLGCCGLAPVMMIDDDVYAKLDDVSGIPEILNKYRG